VPAVTGSQAERTAAHFDELYGLEFLECSADEVRGRLNVGQQHKQPAGLLHGGVYAAMAESLASLGTQRAVYEKGMQAMGMSNSTTFVRPVTEGTVLAVGHPRHRGRTTWLWDLEFTDDRDRLVALSRMTIAVRPARP
jgi:1,4-dihydroxy-2-naphthoyl-CoA hydrolase